jgi:hypothetical protein
VKLKLSLWVVKLERLGKTLGYAFQIDLFRTESGGLNQSDFVLTEGENVEPKIPRKERQQGLDMKAIRYNNPFLEPQRHPIGTKHLGRKKDRQTVALASPESVILQESLSLSQELLDFQWPKALIGQAPLSLP